MLLSVAGCTYVSFNQIAVSGTGKVNPITRTFVMENGLVNMTRTTNWSMF